MKIIKIYPAGGIQKGKEDTERISWMPEDMELFKKTLLPHKVMFIDPRYRNDNLNNPLTVLGRDLMAVKISDFVVVDAREKRGLGVGQEMMYAKMKKIPVISVAPRNTYYKRDRLEYLGQDVKNFIHPFLFGSSDAIVENFEEAAKWVKDFLEKPCEVKDFSVMNKAMDSYVKNYLDDDEPLKRAVKDEAPED